MPHRSEKVNMESIARAIGATFVFIVTAIVVVALTIYNAWAIHILWVLFGAPLSHCELTFGQCAGLYLLFSWTKGYTHREGEELEKRLLYEALQPITLVLVGLLI